MFCRVWEVVCTCFVGSGRGFGEVVHTCFVGFGRRFLDMVHICFVGFVEVLLACFDSVGKQAMKWSVIMHNVFVRNFKYV